jgi:putative ABC transport system ATP-binding protein
VSTLQLRNVVKHYPGGGETIRAVDGVSLTVSPGELIAVYGPSGSGKTTLLQLAAGLLTADSGNVIFDGRDIDKLPAAESAAYRRRDVGLVFQSFHLIAGASALDNAALKLLADGFSLRDARLQARPWIARVGLSARLEHVPARLSMGECQRVALARALANEPRLLLADEPTGSLDSKRSREILMLLQEICQERQLAGVLVTHDPQAAAFASSVHTLCDGKLQEGIEETQPAIRSSP